MSTEPISRASLTDQAYRAIMQLIVIGELAPGTPLRIDALSQRLGVSSSPIRESLRWLEREGWVDTITFRGAFVSQLDKQDLAELYEVREALELAAVRKVMPTPLPKDLKVLSQMLAEIQAALKAGDQRGYLEADTRFHQKLVDMAGNRRLSEIFTPLVEQGKCFALGRTREEMAQHKDGQDDHAGLFDAISKGDMERALDILHHHLSLPMDKE